jgi:negative regulator of sigma E activity
MSDLLNEQLSALLDGELPPEQTALLLRRIEREPELAARLGRFRICGEVLRGDRIQPRADFALRVSAAIAAEPAPAPQPAEVRQAALAGRPARIPGWLKSATGLAVAASVGMLALLVLQRAVPGVLEGTPPQSAAAVVAEHPPSSEPAEQVARVVTPPLTAPGSDEPRSYVTPAEKAGLEEVRGATLANYVVAHSSVSGPLGGHNVLIHLLADPPADGNP